MGLISHAIAVGIGYHFAQPTGRRQLTRLRRWVTDLARTPQVEQLREQAWERVGERAVAPRAGVANRLANIRPASASTPTVDDSDPATHGRRDRGLRGRGWRRARPYPAAPAGPDTDTATPDPGSARSTGVTGASGFSGTTVAEDSHAVITGTPAPPLAARTPPPATPTP
jgi:hypothetical protein